MMLLSQLLMLALGSLLLCGGVGAVVGRLMKTSTHEPFFDWFLRLLSGVIVVTAGYAIVQTRGATILLPALLLILAVLYNLRRREGDAPTLRAPTAVGQGLALMLGMGVVVFAMQYLLVYEPGSPFLQTPFQDYVFYSRLAMLLNGQGLETNSLEVVFPQFQTEQPYHYLEVWLNALLVRATELPSVWVLMVSAGTVLITTCSLGFAAIYRHFGMRPGWAVLLGLATLSVTGTVWPTLTKYPLFANSALLNTQLLASNIKLAPVYMGMLLGGLLLLRQRFIGAGMALALVPLVSVATVPSMLAGVAGLAVYRFVSKEATWRETLGVLAPMLFALLYGAAFYILQPESFHLPATGRESTFALIIPAANEIKTLVNITIGMLLIYAVAYAGYGLLAGALVLLHRRWWPVPAAGRPVLVWVAATVTGAALMCAVGHNFLDSYQFFSNAAIPVTAVGLAVAWGWGLQATARGWVLGCLVGLGALVFASKRNLLFVPNNTRFSPEFLQQVGPVLRQLPNRGGYLMADADYENAYMMSADSYTAGTYVSNFKNSYLLPSLSALVPDDFAHDPRFSHHSAQATLIQSRTTLFRLFKLSELQGHPLTREEAPLALVRRAGLAFICASRRAVLPPSLEPLVQARYHDAYSGETLYVLKHQVPTGPLPDL